MHNKLVNTIIESIQDKKGYDITDINLQKIENAICDHFIICHGDSRPQVEAIAENIERQLREKLHTKPVNIDGKENAQWILIDYHHVMVHVFQREYRNFYNLEELWADAKIKQIETKY
jgi:ribosome-associated protein